MINIPMIKKLFKLALIEPVERMELFKIVRTLAEDSVIVEVGSFMGGSAAIMSIANPLVQIHCFDPFESDTNYKHTDTYKNQYNVFFELLGRQDARSIENVGYILKDYSNIHLHKRHSPHNITWTQPIDLYFEDGVHSDPELTMNLNFWTPMIKSGGYLVLHDHRPWLELTNPFRHVDIEQAYDRLLSQGYKKVSKVRSLTILQKSR